MSILCGIIIKKREGNNLVYRFIGFGWCCERIKGRLNGVGQGYKKPYDCYGSNKG